MKSAPWQFEPYKELLLTFCLDCVAKQCVVLQGACYGTC